MGLKKLMGVAVLASLGGVHAASATDNDAAQQVAAKTWTLSIENELRHNSWSATRGTPTNALRGPGKGGQFYMPVSVDFGWQPNNDFRFSLLARSGWVWGEQSSGGGLNGAISTMTDTSLTGTVTYAGLGIIQPFASLALNLPTGRARLTGRAPFARMDSDLVEVANYGGGLSTGPTFGLNISLSDNTQLTLSAGHTFANSYRRDSVAALGLASTLIDPPNTTTVNAQIAHNVGQWSLSLAGLYTASGNSKTDGVANFRSGLSYAVNGSLAYAWSEDHRSTFSGSWGSSDRNFSLNAAIGFVRDQINFNSQTLRFGLDHSWNATEKLTLGVSTSWFRRDRNSYSLSDLSFIPAKTKISLGVTAKYKVNEMFSINGRVEHYRVHELNKPDSVFPGFGLVPGSGTPPTRSNGLLVSLGSTANF